MTTYGSLFTGAGGFELGFDPLGWKCSWMVEKDIYARKVLQARFSDIPLYEDVFEYSFTEPVDVIIAGFPCQSFSNSGFGRGEGMVYFDQIVRITREMREYTDGKYPRGIIWENVPGILNRKRDWLSYIYTAWAEIGAVVQEHRVIDLQYFGVPQRRKRVLGIVGFDIGAERAGEILFDNGESGKNIEQSGVTGSEDTEDHQTSSDKIHDTIVFDPAQITHPENRSNPKVNSVVHTLVTSGKPPVIIKAADLTTSLIDDIIQIRKLTPLECERLMGWPDQWTDVGISNLQRYRLCGNGLAAPMSNWVGKRLEKIL